MRAVLLSAFLCVSFARQVRMYWNTGDPEKNLDYVRQQGGLPISDYITGVLPCCNIAEIRTNGTFVVHRDINDATSAYKTYGLTVHPVASIPDLTVFDNMKIALEGIPDMVQWIQDIKADGVLIDYEPSKNYSWYHVAHYVEFLSNLQRAMKKVNKQAGMDIASWGILNNYTAYCASPIDFLTTMSGWYQSPQETETNAVLAAGCLPSSLHVGISDQCTAPNITCHYTPQVLSTWVEWLLHNSIEGIDVWTPDSPQNTPEWYFSNFKAFLQG